MNRRILMFACTTLIGAGPARADVAAITPDPTPAGFYVSPTGTAGGDGSFGNPWDLQTALNSPAVRPGDTIWVRGGTYKRAANPAYTTGINGTAGNPITIRAYPGEFASLDAVNTAVGSDALALRIQGAYLWFWGLDITNSQTARQSTDPAVAVRSGTIEFRVGAANSKVINCTIHDGVVGVGHWIGNLGSPASNNEVNGCIIYNNGVQGVGGSRGIGHNLYLQNYQGTLTIKNNIIFSPYNQNVQVYGSTAAYGNNIRLIGNDIANAQALQPPTGGGAKDIWIELGNPADSPVIDGNTVYETIANSNAALLGGLTNLMMTNNYFYTGPDMRKGDNGVFTWGAVTGNTISGAGSLTPGINGQIAGAWGPVDFNFPFPAGNTLISGKPTTNYVVVRPNDYEPGRANIVVFNWTMLSSVSVNISSAGLAVGQQFKIIDAQNPLGAPVYQGIYSGSPVSIPMTSTAVTQPLGTVTQAAVHTSSEYGAFVVVPGAAPVVPGAAPTADGKPHIRRLK
jgi:hypothetical protein